MKVRHFLSLFDFDHSELDHLLERAVELKHMQRAKHIHQPCAGRMLALVFEKASTRTRVSFETGMAQLGGHSIFMHSRDSQLGRGEPIADTARVLSSMVDLITLRTFSHDTLATFAEYSQVPVINSLTDHNHPCQLLSDIMTYRELRGREQGITVAWIGDGNNVCNTYIEAAERFDFQLRIACPEGYEPNQHLLDACADRVEILRDPAAAVRDAQLITTDVWASMGQEDEQQHRSQAFAEFTVNQTLMDQAHKNALFLHCLPAHRGEEVEAEVIDGTASGVWVQAENRMHAQKALIEFLLTV